MTALIVDGNPLIWRSSRIYSQLRTSTGTPSGCIYGAIENLSRGVKAVNPSSVTVVWDAGRCRWREALYPAYKANRHVTKTDEERAQLEIIRSQMAPLSQIIGSMGLHQVAVEGVEGDDLIGICTTALSLLRQEPVVILGSDHDLYQLITPLITMYDPIQKKWITEETVIRSCGLPPSKVVEAKCLSGDSGDNVPGLARIGPARASELLSCYRTLDNLIAVLQDPPTRKEWQKRKWTQSLLDPDALSKIQLTKRLVSIATCTSCSELNEHERAEIQRQCLQQAQPDRFRFAGLADRYELHTEHADALAFPAPNYEGIEKWLSSG